MAERQLSVRSARAKALAHTLSQREGRPIHAIVEDALESYSVAKGRSDFSALLSKLQTHTWPKEDGEISLDDLMAELDRPHEGQSL
jgi:hypothetical protein